MDDGLGDDHAVGIDSKTPTVERFVSNTDLIERKQLFAICRDMPKGAHLHLHFNVDSTSTWERFNEKTRMMKDLFNSETAYRNYTQQRLDEFAVLNNNILPKPRWWKPAAQDNGVAVKAPSKYDHFRCGSVAEADKAPLSAGIRELVIEQPETRPIAQLDVVPDTRLLPPPPSFLSGWDRSSTDNAIEADAEFGEQWCRQHPLTAFSLDSVKTRMQTSRYAAFVDCVKHTYSAEKLAPITLGDTAVASLKAHRASLFSQTAVGETIGAYEYSRSSNPNRASFEAALAACEHAKHALERAIERTKHVLAFSSGSAASTGIPQFSAAGSHVISVSDVYRGAPAFWEPPSEDISRLVYIESLAAPSDEFVSELLEESLWEMRLDPNDTRSGSGYLTQSKTTRPKTWDPDRTTPNWHHDINPYPTLMPRPSTHGRPDPSKSFLNLPRRLGTLLRLLLPPTLLSLLPLVTSVPALIPYRTPKIIFLSFSAISSLSTGMTSLQLPRDVDHSLQLAKMWLRILCSVALGVLTVCYTLWFLNGWYARKKRAFLAGFLGCTVFCWVFVNPGLQGGSSSGDGGKKGGEGDGFVWLDELNLFGLIAVVVGILNAESSLIGAIFSGGGGVGEGVEAGTRAVEDEESQVGIRRSRDGAAARDHAGETEDSSNVRLAGILSLVNNVVGS